MLIAAPRGVMDIEFTNSPELSVWSLSRFPHGFWWCWSRRPSLGALNVWGAHVWIRIYGSVVFWGSNKGRYGQIMAIKGKYAQIRVITPKYSQILVNSRKYR